MVFTTFRNRRVARIENELVRVSVTVEGGHIAEILEKSSGVNPLWVPPWPSIEPSLYAREKHPEYGDDAESRLLAGIMGHNLCLDLFGPPSKEEALAGLNVHGEAGIVPWDLEPTPDGMICRAVLPHAQIAFERRLHLANNRLEFKETVRNLSIYDRPIAWTQHVTLGPPFLERGNTTFTTSNATETFTSSESSAHYSANALDEIRDTAFFTAHTPSSGVWLTYEWQRTDFPWLGIWEENHSRLQPPWNGETLTRGMEFGVSPYPEPRRQMIERGHYRWLPAKGLLHANYRAQIGTRPT